MSGAFQEMRRQYMQSGLVESDLAADPFDQFQRWFADSDGCKPGDWFETNAMTLSTASAAGEVSSRVVLLKGVDEGFVFYTNYRSRKGKDLAGNPRAALNFLWMHVERQVRVVGQIEKTSRELSAEYFRTRPKGSKFGAWASEQSAVVADRAELEARFAELEEQYAQQDVPLPDWWGGYRLKPTAIEFWQGRTNRLHDRLRYSLKGADWIVERLAP